MSEPTSMTRKCIKCKAIKNVNSFNLLNSNKGYRNSYCKICQSLYSKACRTEREQSNRQLLADFLTTHPCVDCGFKHPAALSVQTPNRRVALHHAITILPSSFKDELSEATVQCLNCRAVGVDGVSV